MTTTSEPAGHLPKKYWDMMTQKSGDLYDTHLDLHDPPTWQTLDHTHKEPPMTKRFLILPGQVRSRHDGDLHHIGARQLMNLYHVNPRECYIQFDGQRPPPGINTNTLIHLAPNHSGNYHDYRTGPPPHGGSPT